MIEPPSELTPFHGRSRARSRVSVTPGLHRPRDAANPDLAELHAWQTLLPRRGGFTGVTAARLHGWWLPPLPDPSPVFAAVGPGEGHAERRGLVVHRLASAPELTLRPDGLRVTAPAETLLACARWLGVLDLVVLADAALRGGTPLPVLREAAKANRSGVVRLRTALDSADPGAESAWETVLRMLHLACGVPVRPQHSVVVDGGTVVRGDLWIVDTRVLHEYDGGHHREPAQFAHDLARTRSLQRAGWLRSGYTAADLLQRPQLVLADADRALGRPHLPDRIGPWTDLLHGSTLTPSVRRRLGTAWARAAQGRGGPPSGAIVRNRGRS